MTCCESPSVAFSQDFRSARCSCGFRWNFGHQNKAGRKLGRPKWQPAWYCEDDYDRGWRLRDYGRHEVVGRRRRGKRVEHVVACPRSGNTIGVNVRQSSSEVYCPDCDRSGDLGPMLIRYRERRQTQE